MRFLKRICTYIQGIAGCMVGASCFARFCSLNRYNEAKQLSSRYLKFNLQQLLKAVVTAVSSQGATCCEYPLHHLSFKSRLTSISGTKILKCREGLNNKAYLLTMDNGLEIFAKLPNPIAGPAYYTTASEVATRSFVSMRPTPKSSWLTLVFCSCAIY